MPSCLAGVDIGALLDEASAVVDVLSADDESNPGLQLGAALGGTSPLRNKVVLVGYGSTTFRNEARERGAEPDECYCVGSLMKEGEMPQVALEVILTNPILSKLRVYQGLGVPELWLFRNYKFELYRLKKEGYEPIHRSDFLPDLDFELIEELAVREDQHDALVDLRKRLSAP